MNKNTLFRCLYVEQFLGDSLSIGFLVASHTKTFVIPLEI